MLQFQEVTLELNLESWLSWPADSPMQFNMSDLLCSVIPVTFRTWVSQDRDSILKWLTRLWSQRAWLEYVRLLFMVTKQACNLIRWSSCSREALLAVSHWRNLDQRWLIETSSLDSSSNILSKILASSWKNRREWASQCPAHLKPTSSTSHSLLKEEPEWVLRVSSQFLKKWATPRSKTMKRRILWQSINWIEIEIRNKF